VAAGKNDHCGVGIAYDSKVCGSRILSGAISDADEAASLNLGYQNVSIYSCSWGPPDNGKTMEGPTILIKKALVNGVENGRGGKGSIFVFELPNGEKIEINGTILSILPEELHKDITSIVHCDRHCSFYERYACNI
jgi:hypothetical protein